MNEEKQTEKASVVKPKRKKHKSEPVHGISVPVIATDSASQASEIPQPALRRFSTEKILLGITLFLLLALNFKIFGVFEYFSKKNSDDDLKLSERVNDIKSLNHNLLLLARKVDDIGKSLDGVRKSPKDNTQNDELRNQVKDLGRKVDVLTAKINPSANIAEPTALTDVNSSKRKQFLFKIKLNAYYKDKKRFPETLDELRKCLGDIPQEDQSKSTRLSFDKDYRGGWYYDKAKGVMQPNVN